MGVKSITGVLVSGTWVGLEAGVISTTAIARSEFGGGAERAFHAPQVGVSLGQSWSVANIVVGYSLQAAVSLFDTGRHSTEEIATITWLGAGLSLGYALNGFANNH